jgi:hypothetical protein
MCACVRGSMSVSFLLSCRWATSIIHWTFCPQSAYTQRPVSCIVLSSIVADWACCATVASIVASRCVTAQHAGQTYVTVETEHSYRPIAACFANLISVYQQVIEDFVETETLESQIKPTKHCSKQCRQIYVLSKWVSIPELQITRT